MNTVLRHLLPVTRRDYAIHRIEAPVAGRLLVHGPMLGEHTMMFYHAYVEAGQEFARDLSPQGSRC